MIIKNVTCPKCKDNFEVCGVIPYEGDPIICTACGYIWRFKYRCSTCGTPDDDYMEERYSFGIYAGRYCSDECWKNSGYRDATDIFSELDAGERLEPDY